jgi:hypothetical protein
MKLLKHALLFVSAAAGIGLADTAYNSAQALPAPSGSCSSLANTLGQIPLTTLLGTSCSVGDKNYGFSTSAYSGNISSDMIPVGISTTANPNEHLLTAGFGSGQTGSGSFTYTIAINNTTIPGTTMTAVTGGLLTGASMTTFTGAVTSPQSTSGSCSLSAPGFTDCTLSGLLYQPGVTSLTLTTSWNITSGSLASLSNTVMQAPTSVPGPLPIVGAAAAFSFSRKLRNRLRASA